MDKGYHCHGFLVFVAGAGAVAFAAVAALLLLSL